MTATDVDKAKAALWASRVAAAKTLPLRLELVLEALTGGAPYGQWARLETLTGISAARWRKAYTHQQSPTSDMIEAVCSVAPAHAFWLVCGVLPSSGLVHSEPAL